MTIEAVHTADCRCFRVVASGHGCVPPCAECESGAYLHPIGMNPETGAFGFVLRPGVPEEVPQTWPK